MMKTLPILLAMAIFCVHYASAVPAEAVPLTAKQVPETDPDKIKEKEDKKLSMTTSEKPSDGATTDTSAAGSLIPSGLFVLVAAIFTGWMQGVEIKL